jgi:hypothetical protein
MNSRTGETYRSLYKGFLQQAQTARQNSYQRVIARSATCRAWWPTGCSRRAAIGAIVQALLGATDTV